MCLHGMDYAKEFYSKSSRQSFAPIYPTHQRHGVLFNASCQFETQRNVKFESVLLSFDLSKGTRHNADHAKSRRSAK